MKVGYFDNAATTYKKPDGMYQYMTDFMLQDGVNVGRENNRFSHEATELVCKTRRLLLSLMNAPETKEVVFCPSATIALNTILFGLQLKDGDNVYISHFEHNAVLRVLYQIKKTVSINIKYLPMSKSKIFDFDLDELKKCFVEHSPKLVIASQVSNVVGNIAPIESITKLAKSFNAITLIDGAQACGLFDLDLANVDYYVFAGHKTLLGPTGIGGFICDKHARLKPYIFGGTGVDSSNMEMPLEIPTRFEAGSLNLMAIAGLYFSVNWIIENKSNIRNLERDNYEKLYELLSSYEFIHIISPRNASSIVACKIDGYTSDEIGKVLSDRGIAVRTGLHCAPETHKYLNTHPEGLIRFSVSCMTNEEDFHMLQETLDRISEEL